MFLTGSQRAATSLLPSACRTARRLDKENPKLSIDVLEPFFDEGWITEVIRPVKSGKEATVYLCRAGDRTGEELVAAKVYRSRTSAASRTPPSTGKAGCGR